MARSGGGRGRGRGTTIIVRHRSESRQGGGHGGAWKVAYADFVTAMMAFFLVMWLINATTEDQRRGLADYFNAESPLAKNRAGVAQLFAGASAFETGGRVSDRGTVEVRQGTVPPHDDDPSDDPDAKPDQVPPPTDAGGPRDGADPRKQPEAAPDTSVATPAASAPAAVSTASVPAGTEAGRRDTPAREQSRFEQAAREIRAAVTADPALADIADQLLVDQTPEGLRLQIVDRERSAMFATGSATFDAKARLLLKAIAPTIAKLSEPLSIGGYTDAAPYPGTDRTNWELSAERANAARRLLIDSGIGARRFDTVTGHADRDLLVPQDPLAPANRRIAIVLLRSAAPAAR